jgi:hypothetical protein
MHRLKRLGVWCGLTVAAVIVAVASLAILFP